MQILKRLSDPIFWLAFWFHALLLTTPFVFTWVNEELFEFPKMLVVYGFTVLITATWLWRMIRQKQFIIQPTVLDIPLLLFVFSQILSTLFSIHPRTSILGYYTRFNGGLLSTISYTLLYYAFTSNFKPNQVLSFLKTTLLGAFLTTLYAIPEHFGHSPSCLVITGQFDVACWVQDVQSRVFASFGQPNWLAAYLITLIPVALVVGIKQTKVWRFSLVALMTIALLFTRSRSGVLGLGVGLGVLILSQLLWYRQAWKTTLVGIALIGLLMVGIGSPFTPALSQIWTKTLATPTATAQSGTVLDTGGTDSGVIRQIVWQGALKVWQRYFWFGSGPETFAYSYYQDRPVEHNYVSEWDFLYNKAHNEFLNYLATTGIVGGFSYILLLVWFGVYCLSLAWLKSATPTTQLTLSILAGIVALSVSNVLGFSTVMVSVLLFWLMGVVVLLNQSPNQIEVGHKTEQLSLQKLDAGQWLAAATTLILGLVLLFQIYQYWWADRLFVRAKSLFAGGQYELALEHFSAAIATSPAEALFYDELAMSYGKLAAELHQAGETTAAAELAATAIKASDYTLALNSRHSNFYKTRARIFINLAQLQPGYLQQAQTTLEHAIALSPTDAKLHYNLALVELASDDQTRGLTRLREVLTLKPNYLSARFELGKQLEATGDLAGAQAEYEYILTNLTPNNPEVTARLAAIASASGQIKP